MSDEKWTALGGLSHRDIAEILGISKSRVEQIEQIALRKLRKAAKARGIEWGGTK